ncbi:MAG: ACP S-malonyltransferase [Deltaproteobacteria bacterium]|nr:ACP S-malonyltransferase [Deltaproteobacteria bacterium]
MAKIAFLFPGQGAQKIGMGKLLIKESPAAKAVFDEADDVLNENFSNLILEGDEEELKRTRNTQPAILTMSIAAYQAWLESEGMPPDVVTGHSLGEYSALVAADMLSFKDAVIAVRARGTFMQEAVPVGVGAMAAVLNLDAVTIQKVCEGVSDVDANEYVAVANYNGPSQTVIAGTQAGVDKAIVALKEAGARRVMPLPVSAPFHCALMEPVKERLETVLAGIDIQNAKIPVVTNVEAQPNMDAVKARELLVAQVTAPVRFTEIAQLLLDDDLQHFVECGPGKALIGMVKRMDKTRAYLNIEDPSSLAKTSEALPSA